MKEVAWCVLMSGWLLGGMIPTAGATDEGGTSMASQVASEPTGASSTTPTSSASPVAAPTRTAEGSITAVNLTAMPPTLQLRETNGKTWLLALDPKTTAVWKTGRMEKLEQLKLGQVVRVRHVMTGGKDLAQSIDLVETAKPMSNAGSVKTKRY